MIAQDEAFCYDCDCFLNGVVYEVWEASGDDYIWICDMCFEKRRDNGGVDEYGEPLSEQWYSRFLIEGEIDAL